MPELANESQSENPTAQDVKENVEQPPVVDQRDQTIQELSAELTTLNKTLDEVTDQNQLLRQEIENLKEQVKDRDGDVESAAATIADLKERNKALYDRGLYLVPSGEEKQDRVDAIKKHRDSIERAETGPSTDGN